MSETRLGALIHDSGMTSKQEAVVMKHLHSHFGNKAFAPRSKVRMLCDGHTEVYADSIEHAYVKGEKKVKIEFSYKDIVKELEKQIESELVRNDISLSKYKLKRADFIHGADHGQGALQAGTKTVLVFEPRDKPVTCIPTPKSKPTPSEFAISFEVGIAEVICKKDTSEVIRKTICDHLTKHFKTIASNPLTIGFDRETQSIKCCFGKNQSLEQTEQVPTYQYVTGDLAFYAMVLGRESHSGSKCFLCRLSAREFKTSMKAGELWTYDLMNEFVSNMKNDKPIEGCKERPWWQMIPISNYLVPLLHTLIGIGNDILDNFRDIVNEDIECLDKKEIAARRAMSATELRVDKLVNDRNEWDASEKGKERSSLKSKIYRTKVALKQMNVIASPQSGSRDSRSGIEKLLDDIEEFVNEGGDDGYCEDEDDGDHEDTDTNQLVNTTAPLPTNTIIIAIQNKIAELSQQLMDCEARHKPLDDERKLIVKEIDKGRGMITRLKAKLVEFRSVRKKTDGGLEDLMLRVLRSIGVELTRYHGGTLAGMDVKKLVANASFVFDEFAKILKAKKRSECRLSDDDIDRLCEEHKQCLLLWDGAFSLARGINPTDHDCNLYLCYVKAAVDCHIRLGISVTPKVHLMLCHVYDQMKNIPGGLGEKMEDWVELMHQIGARARRRFRTTRDVKMRAGFKARMDQRGSRADIKKRISEVAEETKRNFVKPITKIEDERRGLREERRFEALKQYYVRRAMANRIVKAMRRKICHECDDEALG